MTKQERFLAWMTDAYGVERSLIPILENHAKDLDGKSGKERIEQHIQETEKHADMLKSHIERLGGETANLKTAASSLMGNLQSVMTGPFEDELIKNALMDYAAEHFEIANYTGLIAAAEELGEEELMTDLEQILAEEQDMAQWLESQLPILVKEVLQEDEDSESSEEATES